jgi:hypothetical protein
VVAQGLTGCPFLNGRAVFLYNAMRVPGATAVDSVRDIDAEIASMLLDAVRDFCFSCFKCLVYLTVGSGLAR